MRHLSFSIGVGKSVTSQDGQ